MSKDTIKRCSCCKGYKTVNDLGMLPKQCPECKGSGWEVSPAEADAAQKGEEIKTDEPAKKRNGWPKGVKRGPRKKDE